MLAMSPPPPPTPRSELRHLGDTPVGARRGAGPAVTLPAAFETSPAAASSRPGFLPLPAAGSGER